MENEIQAQSSLSDEQDNLNFSIHHSLRSKISFDLNNKMKNYQSNSSFKRDFLINISCVESSFYRYLTGKSTPSFKIIKEIYGFILEKPTNEIECKDLPLNIQDYYFQNDIQYTKNINELLSKTDAHREIYWLTSNQSCVNIKELNKTHGTDSISEAINDLIKNKVIKKINDNLFMGSSTRAEVNATYSVENINHLANNIFRKNAADNDQQSNIHTFEIFNLSNEGEKLIYNEYYKFLDRCHEIEKSNKGDEKIALGSIYENLNICFDKIVAQKDKLQ